MTKKIILIAALLIAGSGAWAQKKVAVEVTGRSELECAKLKSYIEKIITDDKGRYTLVATDEGRRSVIENEQSRQLGGSVSTAEQRAIGEASGIDYILRAEIKTGFIKADMLNIVTHEVGASHVIEEPNLKGAAYEIAEKVLDMPHAYAKWRKEEETNATRRLKQEKEDAERQAKRDLQNAKRDAELAKIEARKQAEIAAQEAKKNRDIAYEKSKEAVLMKVFLMYRASLGAWGGVKVGWCRYAGGYVQARGGTLGVDMTHFHPNKNFDLAHGNSSPVLYRRSIDAGVMARVFTNHFHVYLGGGYGMYGKIYKSDEKLPADDKYMYYTEKDGVGMKEGFECEAGAILSIKWFSVSGGYTLLDPFKNRMGELHFGIGFNF